MNTTGTITSFSAAKGAYFDIGGDSYSTLTALKSYSLSNPDPQTLRFEIRPGDRGWNDIQSGEQDDRSQVNLTPALINPGTPVAIDYQFMVQPNGPNNTFTNTASWFVTGEMQSGAGASLGASPSFAVELAPNSNHLRIVARYVQPGGNPSNGSSDLRVLTLWTDPNPIQPGQYKDINLQANVSNSGGGYLKVSIDGKQVVNYQGPLGYGDPTYWIQGLYRNAGPTETVIADYRNLTMVTGSQASSWQGVGSTAQPSAPTTPTSPATPTSPIASPVTPPTSTTPSTPTAPTTPTTPTIPTTPTNDRSSATTPVLSVADPTLLVRGRGGTVDLGVNVTTTDTDDRVSLNISGLPKYETITTSDGGVFRGNNITLTSAQANGGLTLTSWYRGGGHPVADLTLTASAWDPATGTVTSSATQTITVTDPRPARTLSSQTTLSSTGTDTGTSGPGWWGQLGDSIANGGTTTNSTSKGSALLSDIRDLVTNRGVATSASPMTVMVASSSTAASLASQGYALLNQSLAGCTGRVDPGQIVAAASNGTNWTQNAFLTKPQH